MMFKENLLAKISCNKVLRVEIALSLNGLGHEKKKIQSLNGKRKTGKRFSSLIYNPGQKSLGHPAKTRAKFMKKGIYEKRLA